MEKNKNGNLPPELLADLKLNEIAGVLGRYLVLKELGLGFTPERDLKIARNEMKGYAFWGAIHKTWSGLYGDGRGIDLADVETAAMMLDVYEEVFDYRGDVEDGQEALAA
jgi:hypothetical protein